MSASWATSTVCSPAVSSRASVSVERRRSRSAGSAAADRSSASGTRRRVSSVPSPSSVSRTNTDRASRCWSGSRSMYTDSAVRAIAPRTPPHSS